MEIIITLFNFLQNLLEQSIISVITASFIWGILSVVLSPCHISSIPIMIGYVNGEGKKENKKVIYMTFLFSIGIFISLILIGIITSIAGKMIGDVGKIGIIVFGLIFISTGLWLLDLININIPMINFSNKNKNGILLGMLFGAVLGPCTFGFMFPILTVIYKYSYSNIIYAILIAFAYALGHSLVIIFSGIFVNQLQIFLNWDSKSKGTIIIKKISGIFVIITGIYLISNKMFF